jgi:hypothetical protein
VSTVPLTPAQPPAVPPQGPPPPPHRRQPSRGALVAALVVAVVLLVGSVGATAAWVHAAAHTSTGITRVVGPNGRTFVFPGSPKGNAGPSQQFQMPMNPGRNHSGKQAGPGKGTATPSPTAPSTAG